MNNFENQNNEVVNEVVNNAISIPAEIANLSQEDLNQLANLVAARIAENRKIERQSSKEPKAPKEKKERAVLNPLVMEIVENLYLLGNSSKDIAKRLNEEGLTTVRGLNWESGNVSQLIHHSNFAKRRARKTLTNTL